MRILTPDKDLGQCIVGDRVVQVDRGSRSVDRRGGVPCRARLPARQHPRLPGADRRHRRRHPRPAGLRREERGRPSSAPTSTSSDPGRPDVLAVRPRGATQLAATLAGAREDALLYRQLATLVDDVPLAEDARRSRVGGVPRERFDAWCDRVGDSTPCAPAPHGGVPRDGAGPRSVADRETQGGAFHDDDLTLEDAGALRRARGAVHAASEWVHDVPASTPPAVAMSLQHAAAFAHTVQSLARVRLVDEWATVGAVDETCPAFEVEPLDEPIAFVVADPEPLPAGIPDPVLPPQARPKRRRRKPQNPPGTKSTAW